MKKSSIALLAQTIVTFDAGTHKTVQDGGDLYILIQQGESGGSEPDKAVSAPEPKKQAEQAKPVASAPGQAPTPVQTAPPAQTTGSGHKYTEDELMKERDINKLLDILDEMGIDPNSYEGKNTNKKLRLLILDAQEGNIVNDEAPAQQEAPAPAQTAPSRGRGRGATAPAGPRELSIDEIEALEDGDMAIVKLDFGDEPNEDADKLWEVEVTGWKVPDGDTLERLHVRFLEDGAEDFIRDGDKMYEYRAQI